MASMAPFSRRQWSSQSVRVTAKELSIVRGKNSSIAERFNKYQMAAEEGNAEKKKATEKPLTLSSGNLSALKKRWEEPEQTQPCTPENAPLQRVPLSHSAPRICVEDPEDPEEPGTSANMDKPQAAAEGGAHEAVPEDERPSVPLNSLKKMFEQMGGTPGTASCEALAHGLHGSAKSNHNLSLNGRNYQITKAAVFELQSFPPQTVKYQNQNWQLRMTACNTKYCKKYKRHK